MLPVPTQPALLLRLPEPAEEGAWGPCRMLLAKLRHPAADRHLSMYGTRNGESKR